MRLGAIDIIHLSLKSDFTSNPPPPLYPAPLKTRPKMAKQVQFVKNSMSASPLQSKHLQISPWQTSNPKSGVSASSGETGTLAAFSHNDLIGRAKDAEAFDFAAIQHLAHDQQPLDGFADANVIGDEHPDGVEAQGHEQRHKLISSRADGHTAERAELRRAFAQSEPRRLPEQVRSIDVGEVVRCWRRKLPRTNVFVREREAHQIGELLVNGDDFVRCARQGPQQKQVVLVTQ